VELETYFKYLFLLAFNNLFLEKDYTMGRKSYREGHQPEYEAWRAERNRIDEDRISRQKTAEGNWRREWDNDKVRSALRKNRTRVIASLFIDRFHACDSCRHTLWMK